MPAEGVVAVGREGEEGEEGEGEEGEGHGSAISWGSLIGIFTSYVEDAPVTGLLLYVCSSGGPD